MYTDAFIKESLRLFLPVPQNGRVPTKDCKFGNVSIPKGTTLLIPNLYIHKNEFEKGEEFIPERWLSGMLYFFIEVLNYILFCKCDVLRYLVPFVQLKKCKKHPLRSTN